MSECLGKDCYCHTAPPAERPLAVESGPIDVRRIPIVARDILIREPDGSLTPVSTLPTPPAGRGRR